VLRWLRHTAAEARERIDERGARPPLDGHERRF
jgi:hypothetical protein